MDTSSEEWRAECMQRAKKALIDFLCVSTLEERREFWMRYREAHGPIAAKELLNMERGVKEGKVRLDRYK